MSSGETGAADAFGRGGSACRAGACGVDALALGARWGLSADARGVIVSVGDGGAGAVAVAVSGTARAAGLGGAAWPIAFEP